MKNRKLNKLITFSIFFLTAYCNDTLDFAKSFIENYDIASKYTHEYHPFVLEKTKNSFKQLRDSLTNSGFSLDNDIVILGYQEDAIPAYTTNWSENKIDDEAAIVTEQGKEQSDKNIFGFLTGFILKDAQWLEQKWNNKGQKFNHILGRNRDFFDDSSVVFQKHALPNDYTKIINIRDRIEKEIYKQDYKNVLSELIELWQTFYNSQLRNIAGKALASQDILFSISYGQTLLDCVSGVNKFFVGPDITYPIETLNIQKEDATVNAQKFIQTLQTNLKPIDNESTAYIFSSFVDGVGKSTLLNNVINWSKYKTDFAKYIRCDNSSSQDSQIYEFDKDVFIVDLPAQISHFAFKPDGSVYNDIESLKDCDQNFKTKLKNFIKQNKKQLEENFENLKIKLINESKTIYSETSPELNFALQTLNLANSQPWIPFEFENKHYIFDKNNYNNIKILVPLSNAHSTGLKEARPEQMLFINGISLPQNYQDFVNNLIDKLKQKNVKKIVFVNFLSMYPRTSRENVRVNFILQYARQIFKDKFKINNSFYKHTVFREQEIYQLLKDGKEDLLNSFIAETAIRMALYELMGNHSNNQLTSLSSINLEQQLKNHAFSILQNYENELQKIALNKLLIDREKMHDQFYLDRIYHNVLKINFDEIIKLSDAITIIFQSINNEYYSNLWQSLNGQLTESNYKKGTVTRLDNGQEIIIVDTISEKSKDADQLTPFISRLRAQLYSSLSALLWMIQEKNNIKDLVGTAPIAVKKTSSGQICLVQKVLPKLSERKFNKNYFLKFCVDTSNKKCWSEFNNIAHCTDFSNIGTYFGLYAYGYIPIPNVNNPISMLINNVVDEYNKETKSNFILPTSVLLEKIQSKNLFKTIEQNYSKKNIVIRNDDEKCKIIQLFIKTICTLDMILKDVNSTIAIQKNDLKDFQTSLILFEKITLPYFFNITISGNLFNDYSQILPIIS
ncbi:hypothetical protein M1446_02945 [Candidatus Dependentiae bacterium]|nr:hypothetical protein [Candidatus Dependentiae bacterium]